MKEEELLDEGFHENKESPKRINYIKLSITYIVLMILIGGLVNKLMNGYNFELIRFLVGAFSFIAFGMIISLLYEVWRWVYGRFISKEGPKVDVHPIGFRILETCFFAWCIIVLITWFGK